MSQFLRSFRSIFIIISFSLSAQARMQKTQPDLGQDTVSYYGAEFYQQLQAGASSDQIKDMLKNILRSYHQHVDGKFDQIVTSCAGTGCYVHTPVGYDAARVYLMGEIHLVQSGSNYAVKEVYCQELYGPERFNKVKPGPHLVPDNEVINIEHTWPQSRFTRKYPEGLQKSDMHHLFPTDSQMNSVRSSFPFGLVNHDTKNLKCKTVRIGNPAGSSAIVFEPPTQHRGNVARALFYFALRYDMVIDPAQEAFLRAWSEQDPVDKEEADRNDRIYSLQGNRNPFIDHPALVSTISDF